MCCSNISSFIGSKHFFFSSRRRHTICALVTGVQTCALPICHQPGERGAVAMEIVLLDPPRLDRVATEKARDISADPLVDPREQVRRRRIERVVEIEDPGVDMGKISAHCRARLGGGGKAGKGGGRSEEGGGGKEGGRRGKDR